MISKDYILFMRRLADYRPFLNVLAASEEQIEKQRHMEYVSRFLVHTYIPYNNKLDVEEFIKEADRVKTIRSRAITIVRRAVAHFARSGRDNRLA
jgi:hypothetical protein